MSSTEQTGTGRPGIVHISHKHGTVPVLLYQPTSSRPSPAIVLGAEAYGLNKFTSDVASRLASAGYVVLVPDYYRGEQLAKPDDYSDFTEVMGFIDRLDF